MIYYTQICNFKKVLKLKNIVNKIITRDISTKLLKPTTEILVNIKSKLI